MKYSFTSISSSSSLFPVLFFMVGEGMPPVKALLIADEKISLYSVSVRDVVESACKKY